MVQVTRYVEWYGLNVLGSEPPAVTTGVDVAAAYYVLQDDAFSEWNGNGNLVPANEEQ